MDNAFKKDDYTDKKQQDYSKNNASGEAFTEKERDKNAENQRSDKKDIYIKKEEKIEKK